MAVPLIGAVTLNSAFERASRSLVLLAGLANLGGLAEARLRCGLRLARERGTAASRGPQGRCALYRRRASATVEHRIGDTDSPESSAGAVLRQLPSRGHG